MTARQTEMLAPLASPLPDLPPGEVFSADQWKLLMAIMDTVVPSVRRESQLSDKMQQYGVPDAEYNANASALQNRVAHLASSEQFDEFMAEAPSSNPRFKSLLERYLAQFSPADARRGLSFVLTALNTRVGSKLLTGYTKPLYEQPIAIRQKILEGWRDSYLQPLNAFHKLMNVAGRNMWLKTSPAISPMTGFPAAPDHYEPGTHYEYEFMQFEAGSSPEIIETDVVVVGSGCGGGVCAKNLADAGHKVLVVEKSYYYHPSKLPMTEEEGGVHLFENGGFINTDDASMVVIAGSTWGGGGTINWSASLQTQGFVRKEWAQDRGLTFFETAEFQSCLDRVCHRMGVSADHIRHNHGNEVLLEGSRKLGWTTKAVPQNTDGKEHYCGHCSMGCGSAEKQGPVVSWLPDAARNGAKFIEGFQVDHVIFDESKGTKKAIGVKGKWTSRNMNGGTDGSLTDRTTREVIIKAKRIIISAGTLWSPIILKNSGIKNPQVGRHLYLHPVNIVLGSYKEDVRPWEGGILTTVCGSFENLDGHGHGVKLETVVMTPALICAQMNVKDGYDFKQQTLKFRHMNGFIAIARDRDPGRVYPDPTDGTPRVQYSASSFDAANIMEGVVALAKICYVTGAEEIHVFILGVPPFIRDQSVPLPAADADLGVTDPKFAAWLANLRKVGNKPPAGFYGSAHQMGTNRMSAKAKEGVVDPKGRVWGTEGLYVSDASVFPSASGVNPMITNMAISDWISRGVSRDLRGSTAAKL